MQAVRALYHRHGAHRHCRRFQKLPALAVIAPVGNGVCAPAQRLQYLLPKPLPVHIAAGLGIPLRRTLLRPEEKVVHVENAASVHRFQQGRQRGFSAGTAALQGYQKPVRPIPLSVNGPQKRQQPHILPPNHPVRRLIGLMKRRGMAADRTACLPVRLHRLPHGRLRPGEPPCLGQGLQLGQRRLQLLRRP